jgi:hypothetical protein
MQTSFAQLLADTDKAYTFAAERTAKQIAALDAKAAAIREELGQAQGTVSSFAFLGSNTDRGTDFAYSLGNK